MTVGLSTKRQRNKEAFASPAEVHSQIKFDMEGRARRGFLFKPGVCKYICT